LNRPASKKYLINTDAGGRSDSTHCSGNPALWHESFYRGIACEGSGAFGPAELNLLQK